MTDTYPSYMSLQEKGMSIEKREKTIWFRILRLFWIVWKVGWSGYFRFLLGRRWWLKLRKYRGITQMIEYPQKRMFFIARDLGNGFAQVRVPSGIMVQTTDTWYINYEIYALNVYNKLYKIRSSDIVVDIGAHVGIFTLKAAGEARCGLVVAVEPNPSNFNILVKNIKLNKVENVIPVNVALTDYNGWAWLYAWGTSGEHFIAQSKIERSHGGFVKVKARTLDSVCDELGIRKIDFLKIDVEGAELKVLAGAERVVKNSERMKLAIAAYHYSNESGEVARFLMARGFEVTIKSSEKALFVYGNHANADFEYS